MPVASYQKKVDQKKLLRSRCGWRHPNSKSNWRARSWGVAAKITGSEEVVFEV
jgi:hypothetical protein